MMSSYLLQYTAFWLLKHPKTLCLAVVKLESLICCSILHSVEIIYFWHFRSSCHAHVLDIRLKCSYSQLLVLKSHTMEVPPVLSLLCLLYILVEHATCLQLEVHDGNYKGPPTQALGFCLLSSTSYIMVIKLVTWYMPYEVNCFVDAISFQRVLTRPSGGGGSATGNFF